MNFPIIDSNVPQDAPVAGLYQHYKGQRYQVLGMARHSETEEWLVVYQALYGEREFWLRPLHLWLEPVYRDIQQEISGSSDDSPDTRFTLLAESELTLRQLTNQVNGESG